MFEVLMFLFENYMHENVALSMDNSAITVELEKIGFERSEIDKALEWLDGLIEIQQATSATKGPNTKSIRHYHFEESERLGLSGRDFLMYLERIEILDPVSREIVIDRIMALDSQEVSISRIRWVVLLVLFNQPERKAALSLMQAMVLADAFDVLH